ncbi:Do family serine endopeptidase [Aureimonas fodinaquatilis]|uniref:Probable periplasmic serine endoprotease DegP-like n=2 Tax=Aureimonas fodinaquatilis TaxID=2565783 RepID=A0A5B0E0V6_9HYPH|nr:Do family serine endopeptidase [Aureimonas fodinaquatilis]
MLVALMAALPFFAIAPLAAQGVIPPPAEGQQIAPQRPPANGEAAGTYNPLRSHGGPGSVADVADPLLDAVVNISTSQRVDRSSAQVPELSAPPGSPLQEFFDELLKGDGNQGARRVQSLGSGFVIDPSGIIVTNQHVISDADEITANFADGSSLPATLVGSDLKTDIAVLKVEPSRPLASVDFGDSDTVRIGDWVMAIGNPFGLGGTVTLGIVSARGRNINAGPYDNFIQTDAAINRGNSGGPLFDMDGKVVGINTAIISPTGGSIGIGFAIPSLMAEAVIGQLREFGETRRGWLGLRLQEVTEEIAQGLGLPNEDGALVMGIIPKGPTDIGQIEIGDVIVRFDGRRVPTSRDLPRMVAETEVGKRVVLDILRKPDLETPATELKVEIELGRLEDGEKSLQTTEEDREGSEPAGEPEAAEAQPGLTLGMWFADMSDELRTRYGLEESVTGVVVTEVDPQSAAAEKGIEAGMVISRVGQEPVSTGDELREKLLKQHADGRRNALLLVASSNGDLRLVVVPLD